MKVIDLAGLSRWGKMSMVAGTIVSAIGGCIFFWGVFGWRVHFTTNERVTLLEIGAAGAGIGLVLMLIGTITFRHHDNNVLPFRPRGQA